MQSHLSLYSRFPIQHQSSIFCERYTTAHLPFAPSLPFSRPFFPSRFPSRTQHAARWERANEGPELETKTLRQKWRWNSQPRSPPSGTLDLRTYTRFMQHFHWWGTTLQPPVFTELEGRAGLTITPRLCNWACQHFFLSLYFVSASFCFTLFSFVLVSWLV